MRDEHDPEQPETIAHADGSWDLEASLRPDEASRIIGVPVPEHEEYETLAGLVALRLGRLASTGDAVRTAAEPMPGEPAQQLAITVTEVDNQRITRLRIRTSPVTEDLKETHA